MNRKLIWICLLACSLFLAACTEEKPQQSEETASNGEAAAGQASEQTEATAEPADSNSEEPSEQHNDETENSTSQEESGTDEQNAEAYNDADAIKQQLKLGLSQEQVIELFGQDYREVTSMLDDSRMWRFDLSAAEGYSFEKDTDLADLEGLAKGNVGAQLFVAWTEEETLREYSLIYMHKEGKLHAYYLFGDGTEKEDILN